MQYRKKARDGVYKLIYEFLFSGEANERTFAIMTAADMPAEELDYMKRAYYGVIEHIDELKSIVAQYAVGFDIARIYKPDLAALVLAIFEMKYMDDIPLNVSISEAVELVKIYSTEKSHAFVNGILSSVYKNITSGK
ncbi:MAG: transcription antitermination factor NusB [Firmicutes bacterium]|uniref:Transcription antitermination protein NusB n=1 Tax=Candidatus Stercoripulliclostridium pullicola TaxID=2840953 RepID=A0A940DHJ5_9FIRM|nr:transcription antitermination factor NusB [Candidatus Stercoripulliclostridium pullicola]